MFGYFSFHEFYMRYFIQVSLSPSLFLICTLSSLHFLIGAAISVCVAVISSRSYFTSASNCLAKILISPLRFDGRASKRLGTFVRRTLPTFFHRAVKLMTTPGTPRAGTRKEGESARGSGDSGNREISRRNSTQSRRRKRKTDRE